jgi:hypothetical protein
VNGLERSYSTIFNIYTMLYYKKKYYSS